MVFSFPSPRISVRMSHYLKDDDRFIFIEASAPVQPPAQNALVQRAQVEHVQPSAQVASTNDVMSAQQALTNADESVDEWALICQEASVPPVRPVSAPLPQLKSPFDMTDSEFEAYKETNRKSLIKMSSVVRTFLTDRVRYEQNQYQGRKQRKSKLIAKDAIFALGMDESSSSGEEELSIEVSGSASSDESEGSEEPNSEDMAFIAPEDDPSEGEADFQPTSSEESETIDTEEATASSESGEGQQKAPIFIDLTLSEESDSESGEDQQKAPIFIETHECHHDCTCDEWSPPE